MNKKTIKNQEVSRINNYFKVEKVVKSLDNDTWAIFVDDILIRCEFCFGDLSKRLLDMGWHEKTVRELELCNRVILEIKKGR